MPESALGTGLLLRAEAILVGEQQRADLLLLGRPVVAVSLVDGTEANKRQRGDQRINGISVNRPTRSVGCVRQPHSPRMRRFWTCSRDSRQSPGREKEDPSPKRFAILTRMLDMEDGDVVVVPKMPKWGQFTIARVSPCYWFADEGKDFRHIVFVYRDSVRTFGYCANNDANLVSLRPLRTSKSLASGLFLLQGLADQGDPPATAKPKRPDLEAL